MKNAKIPSITSNNLKLWFQSINQKILIRNSTVAGAMLFFVLFIFLPLFFQTKRLSTEVKNVKQKISQANVKIAKIPEMTKQKELFGTRIKKLRGEFFEPNETDKLIEIISTAANDSGVKINASRPSAKILELQSPFDKQYIPVSYELIIEGPYHAIGKFINTFESYPKSFAVHDLQIIEQSEGTGGQRQGVLTLTAFIKHPTTT